MRLALWHGWRLEGSGSNVYTARIAEVLRAGGHDVLLLCQDPTVSSMPFVDGVGTVSGDGVSPIEPTGAAPAAGRLTVLRPDIGKLLPVFVVDVYEGSDVKRFVDLTDDELSGYLRRNADALRVAVEWHGSEAVVAGHAVPGPSVARLALGPGRYVAKVHGSDLEYAVRQQPRLRDLAREGLEGAVAVTGSSENVLRRTAELFPAVGDRLVVAPPGVDPERFRPVPRDEGLATAVERLEADPRTLRGRPSAPRRSTGSPRGTTRTRPTPTPPIACAWSRRGARPSSRTSASSSRRREWRSSCRPSPAWARRRRQGSSSGSARSANGSWR
jgi:glycosyltransferase involved in cell wall biosynthesis